MGHRKERGGLRKGLWKDYIENGNTNPRMTSALRKAWLVQGGKVKSVLRAKRNYKQIMNNLLLEEKDLKGKRILDISSGISNFIDMARKKGAKAYGVDPFRTVRRTKLAQLLNKKPPTRYVGMAQAIPFKDESFDLVVSHGGISIFKLWANEKAEKADMYLGFYETARVLSKGGEARIAPVDADMSANKPGMEEVLVAMKKAGFTVEKKATRDPLTNVFFNCLFIRKTKDANMKKLRELMFGA